MDYTDGAWITGIVVENPGAVGRSQRQKLGKHDQTLQRMVRELSVSWTQEIDAITTLRRRC